MLAAETQSIRPIAELEREAIVNALRIVGDKLEAAQRLGIGRTTLYRKVKEFGIAAAVSHQSRALAELPTPPLEKVPIRFLRIPSTQPELEQAHLRCPHCRTMLCE